MLLSHQLIFVSLHKKLALFLLSCLALKIHHPPLIESRAFRNRQSYSLVHYDSINSICSGVGICRRHGRSFGFFIIIDNDIVHNRLSVQSH